MSFQFAKNSHSANLSFISSLPLSSISKYTRCNVRFHFADYTIDRTNFSMPKQLWSCTGFKQFIIKQTESTIQLIVWSIYPVWNEYCVICVHHVDYFSAFLSLTSYQINSLNVNWKARRSVIWNSFKNIFQAITAQWMKLHRKTKKNKTSSNNLQKPFIFNS